MNPDTLARFSKDDLIALIVAQAEVIARQTAQIEALTKQIDVLMKRVEALEAELGKPPKTPDNSSVPPSQGHKPNRAERRAGAGCPTLNLARCCGVRQEWLPCGMSGKRDEGFWRGSRRSRSSR